MWKEDPLGSDYFVVPEVALKTAGGVTVQSFPAEYHAGPDWYVMQCANAAGQFKLWFDVANYAVYGMLRVEFLW